MHTFLRRPSGISRGAARSALIGIATLVALSAGPVVTVGATVPNTTITAGPSGPIASRTATFRFTADVTGSTFQCRLDGGSWATCTSPKSYASLSQGLHTFRVRARKGTSFDATPAKRDFTVDTVPPSTTITGGPEGYTEDKTPTFTFSSTEPGSFECKLGAAMYAACVSPYTHPSSLPDESYTFAVRARDAAGNVDATPAKRAFDVETPLTESLGTALAIFDRYFPDSNDLDVPASCGGSADVDCPGGTPSPPADQLRVTPREVTVREVAGTNRYDVSVALSVETLLPVRVAFGGADCNLTMTSAPGIYPTWRVDLPLHFIYESDRVKWVDAGDMTVTQVESDDYELTGAFLCTIASYPPAAVTDVFVSTLRSHFEVAGDPMCAAPGPAYLGPCPEPGQRSPRR